MPVAPVASSQFFDPGDITRRTTYLYPKPPLYDLPRIERPWSRSVCVAARALLLTMTPCLAPSLQQQQFIERDEPYAMSGSGNIVDLKYLRQSQHRNHKAEYKQSSLIGKSPGAKRSRGRKSNVLLSVLQ